MRAEAAAETRPSPWPTWPDGYADSAEDRRALLVLSALRGITPRGLITLALECGSASASLAAIRDGRAGSDNDRAFARSLDADAMAAAAKRCGARFVTWGSAEYPSQLRTIADPPAALYLSGHPLPDAQDAVAIVGARRCTELGRELAHEMGRGLGLAGLAVVSGAARGIDSAAHEGALSAGGRTLAVLGCGIDVDYPRGGGDLMRRVREHGAIVSEYPPGTPPSQRNFPARNRIVAGLCAATVVVEGATGSGSTITAEHAMEFGRDVFAVPGPVTSPLSQVPLQLIREGATMIRGSEDLLHDLGREPVLEEVVVRTDLSEGERRVLERLSGPTLPERIASALGVGVPEVVSVLMRLELRGFVRGVGGRYEPTLRAGSG
jgi:DNA processing protein